MSPIEIAIKKQDAEQQIVFGEVFAPGVIDAQGDRMSAEEIAKAAYLFMAKGRLRVSYTAGFTATDGQHYDAVPGWLALAARLHARVALSAHPMFVQNQSTADARVLEGQLGRILEHHARYMPWAETPRVGVTV